MRMINHCFYYTLCYHGVMFHYVSKSTPADNLIDLQYIVENDINNTIYSISQKDKAHKRGGRDHLMNCVP